MASITSKKKGKYTKKESASELTQVFLETVDSQVLLESAITLDGTTYAAGTPLSSILAILNSTGGKYQLAAGETANIVKIQCSTDGGTTYEDVNSVTVNNVANATNATNVALSASGSGTASISISAGSGTAASFTVNNVANATNATNATNVALSAGTSSGTAGATVTAANNKFEIGAGSGTKAIVAISSVPEATKATQDGSGNTITSTYATKTELAEVEMGTTKGYVTSSTLIYSITTVQVQEEVAKLLKSKDAGQTQWSVTLDSVVANKTVQIPYGTDTLTDYVDVEDLVIGDAIYLKDSNLVDWFVSGKVTSQGVTTVTFTSIEADVPVLSGYVTGSSLTSDSIILGNGNSTVKASGKSITTTAPTSSSTDDTVPTSKAVWTAIDTITSGGVSTADTLTANKIILGNGNKTVKTSTYGIAESTTTVASGDEDKYVATVAKVSDMLPTSFTITANATDGLWDLTGTNGSNAVTYSLGAYSAKQTNASFYTGTTNPNLTTRLNYDGYLYATKLYSGGSEVLTSHNTISGTSPISASTSGNTVTITHDASGVSAGTYSAVTVNTYGHVTAGAQMIKYVASESADVSDVAIGGTVVVVGNTVSF